MTFKDLPTFLEYLEKNNHLKRIKEVISTHLEVTEISKRFLHTSGPALLFENVVKEDGKKSQFPIVTNLYAHPQRISWALGLKSPSELREFGKLLAFLKNPEPPSSIKETFSMLPIAKRILSMSPKNVKKAVKLPKSRSCLRATKVPNKNIILPYSSGPNPRASNIPVQKASTDFARLANTLNLIRA